MSIRMLLVIGRCDGGRRSGSRSGRASPAATSERRRVVRASRWWSPSVQRAMAHNRSESRLRYVADQRPLRRGGHRQALGPAHHRAGQVQSGRGPVRPGDDEVGGHLEAVVAGRRSAPRAPATISAVTRVAPATSFVRLDGAVATSAMSTYRSRSRRGQELVELRSGLCLGPGQAHRRLGLVDGPVELAWRPSPCAPDRRRAARWSRRRPSSCRSSARRPHRDDAKRHRPRAPTGSGGPAHPDGGGRRERSRPWHRLRPIALLGYGCHSATPASTYLEAVSRAGGHLRRRHGHQPAAAPTSTADDFGGPDLEGCNELLVVTRPDVVDRVHRSFFDVGCDVVETDTFGAFALGPGRVRAGRPGPTSSTWPPPAWPARRPTTSPRRTGPAGWPAASARAPSSPRSGQIPFAELRDAYEEQAAALARGRRRPAHHRDGVRPPPGQGGHQRGPAGHGGGRPPRPAPGPGHHRADRPHAAGHRDRRRPDRPRRHARRRDRPQLRHRAGRDERAAPLPVRGTAALPISCLPNAGLPSVVDGKHALRPHPRAAGRAPRTASSPSSASRVVGGCCGTTPDHLAAVVERCADLAPAPRHPGARAGGRVDLHARSPSTRTPRSWSSASGPTPTGRRSSARPCSRPTGTPAWPWPATRSRRAPTSSTCASTTPAPTAWPT